MPATGTAAASSKERLVGLRAILSSVAHTYSAEGSAARYRNPLSPGLNCVNIRADCFDFASHISAKSCGLGCATAVGRETRATEDSEAVQRIHRSGVNPYQNFIVPGPRLFNFFIVDNILMSRGSDKRSLSFIPFIPDLIDFLDVSPWRDQGVAHWSSIAVARSMRKKCVDRKAGHILTGQMIFCRFGST